MPSSPQGKFLAELNKIRYKALEIFNSQGFLTDIDVKNVWLEERYDKILFPNNLLGFPENHSKDSKISFLESRTKILLTLIEVGGFNWDKCYPNLCSDKRKDEALPLTSKDLDFLTVTQCEVFEKCQWRFNPPKLKEHGEIKKYDSGAMLPLIKSLKKTISEGSSGVVTRESIPVGYWEDCKGNPNTEVKVVARKLLVAATSQLKPAKSVIEVRNLQSFRESRNKHRGIMNCLAYVLIKEEEEEKLSIIMDEADTDLNRYLPYEEATFLETPNPTLRDLLTEAAELAGALGWLHEDIQIKGEILACCHMDLNPRNILIFHEEGSLVGTWKIADFGISAIRTPKQVPGKSNDNQASQDTIETIVTKAKRYQGPYTAPEIYDRRNEVGRNSDIWSYGCILVDIIASKLTGEASLFSLTEKRHKKGINGKDSHSNDHFYRKEVLNEKGALNKHVGDWIDGLDTARGDKGQLEGVALSDCKKLLKNILVLEPHRPRAHDIRKRLIKALDKIPKNKGAPGSSMT